MDTKLFSRKQSGGMFSILDREQFPTGNIWWVGSTVSGASDTAGHGQNPDAPFATWVYAETQASADDTIFLLPAHAETIGNTGAAAITLDVAGLKTIGLGGRTRRPQILIDGFDDTYISITAADTVLQNIAFSSGHADVVKGVNIAAAGAEIRDCQFLENAGSENYLICILTTAAADDLLIDGCTFDGVTQATECIELVGANDRTTITNNKFNGLFSVSAISNTTAPCLGIDISNNYIGNHTTAGDDLAGAIDLNGTATGWICNNRIYLGDNTDCLTSIDGGNCVRGDNRAMNEYDEDGGPAATLST